VKRLLILAMASWLMPVGLASTVTDMEPRVIPRIQAGSFLPVYLAKPMPKTGWDTVGLSVIDTKDSRVKVFVADPAVPKSGLTATAVTTDGRVKTELLSLPRSVGSPSKSENIIVYDAKGKPLRIDRGVILSRSNSPIVVYYKAPRPGFRWDYTLSKGVASIRQVPIRRISRK